MNDLYKKSKEQLIFDIQDYQELVSEIEEVINAGNFSYAGLLKIRDLLDKFLG